MLDEIRRFGTVRQQEPGDIFASDISDLPGMGQNRGRRVLKELVNEGVLLPMGRAVNAKTRKPATAYQLAPGRKPEDIGALLRQMYPDEVRDGAE